MRSEMNIGGKTLKKLINGEKECWVWGEWESSEHDSLEERPWTPQVINSKLCFSAKDADKWVIVWGDSHSPYFDDAYDIDECQRKPVYVARDGHEWFLVWNRLESQRFKHQVTFRIVNGEPEIYEFEKFVRGQRHPIKPVWEKIA